MWDIKKETNLGNILRRKKKRMLISYRVEIKVKEELWSWQKDEPVKSWGCSGTFLCPHGPSPVPGMEQIPTNCIGLLSSRPLALKSKIKAFSLGLSDKRYFLMMGLCSVQGYESQPPSQTKKRNWDMYSRSRLGAVFRMA